MKIAIFIFLSGILISSCKSAKESKTTTVDEIHHSGEQIEGQSDNKKSQLDKEIAQIQDPLSDSVLARIQRTPCFGTCPIYTMTIYQGGYVTFHGEKFVDMEGHYEGKSDKNKLEELIESAEEVGFFQLDREYDNPRVTDLPSTIITMAKGESFKTVINRYSGPPSLTDFQKKFDELIKQISWKKMKNEQEK